MKNSIKSVRVFESKVNYHNGDDIGPSFAVIVDPHPITETQKWQVAQAITECLRDLKIDDTVK